MSCWNWVIWQRAYQNVASSGSVGMVRHWEEAWGNGALGRSVGKSVRRGGRIVSTYRATSFIASFSLP